MVKITTDSTCDLPAQLLEQHDITVIPLGIVKAGRLYQDGINIRTADIAASALDYLALGHVHAAALSAAGEEEGAWEHG